MTGSVSIRLRAGRAGEAPSTVTLRAPADAETGAALDRLGAELGLPDAGGAVQARSHLSGTWLDRSLPIARSGLLRGERLELAVGLAPVGASGTLHRWTAPREGDAEGRVAVNRPPRIIGPEPAITVRLPSRAGSRAGRRFPLGAILIPLVLGGLLIAVTRRWEIALFALFSPVMIFWNYVEERRARADELKEYGRSYAEESAATVETAARFAAGWATWLLAHHPSPVEVAAITRSLDRRLWERHRGDPDYLRLRVGTAQRTAPAILKQDVGREPDREVAADCARRLVVDGVPAVVDLGEGTLAVLGEPPILDAVAGWLVAQLAALHSPADVMLVGALADDATRDWFTWLPHVPDGLLTCKPVAATRSEADELIRQVSRLAEQRRAARGAFAGNATAEADLVLVLDDRLGPDPALLNTAAQYAEVGVHVVWLGREARAVPGTAAIIYTPDPGTVVRRRTGERLHVRAETLPADAAAALAAELAPVRDVADPRRARPVPERLVLTELVPDALSPAAIRRAWETAPVSELIAELGLAADGPLRIDLGPSGSHVLVGGTTGSGKSELLQTLVTSLAIAYPPDRVGFLLVDYKGGAAFKDATRLPHSVGVVTDLDPHLTRRVLLALDAEIKRREELLAAGRARDLSELRAASPATAPGDLVIVVDEFATLAKEIPEFVEGVVDVAARGRSLGLRLVLATQRPAGVISDRIRANVGVRVALRLNDEADSLDVIDDRRAAHIRRDRPGRAFVRVHRDVEEFQAAFVGGPARTGAVAPIDVIVSDGAALRRPAAPAPDAGPTVLQAVVDACEKVMRVGQWRRPHVPWLPALKPVITLAELSGDAPELPDSAVLLARADLPHRQQQRAAALDLDRHPSLLVFGTSRSGKTTTLRTIAAGLVENLSPEQLNLYVLDFTGHGLQPLETAPQCGGVAGPDDLGQVARMVRRLGATIEERKRLLSSSGAASLRDLARSGAGPLPRIVVLLDGWSAAAATLERVDGGRLLERLERLVADGPAVGLHVVITADRRAAVPGSLTSVITARLVLRMAERDDYLLLGVDAGLAQARNLGPGRGFLQGATEVQVAVAGGADPNQQAAELAARAARARERWGGTAVRPVGRMPTQVGVEDVPAPASGLQLPIGIGDVDLDPVGLDLDDQHALVGGPPRSGRTTVLAAVAWAATRAPEPPALVLVTARRSPLSGSAAWAVEPVDAAHPDRLAAGLRSIDELLAAGRTVLCLCDDADLLPDAASTALEGLARRGRDERIRIVASADNRSALRAYGGLIPELRRSKQGVLLSPEIDLDGDLLGVRLRPPVESPTPRGRGFLVRGGAAELVQILFAPAT